MRNCENKKNAREEELYLACEKLFIGTARGQGADTEGAMGADARKSVG